MIGRNEAIEAQKKPIEAQWGIGGDLCTEAEHDPEKKTVFARAPRANRPTIRTGARVSE